MEKIDLSKLNLELRDYLWDDEEASCTNVKNFCFTFECEEQFKKEFGMDLDEFLEDQPMSDEEVFMIMFRKYLDTPDRVYFTWWNERREELEILYVQVKKES